jgi:hypothetical protein
LTQGRDANALPARRRAIDRAIARSALLLAAVTAAFFLLPVQSLALGRTVLVTAVFLIGLAGAAWIVVWQVMAYRTAVGAGRARLQGLLVAVYITVLFFALSYYLLATAHPEQFVGLQTRLDSLYFSITILSTVGFGDVHAAGQAGRAIVSLQLAFDLLFISLAVAAVRAAGPPTAASDQRSG